MSQIIKIFSYLIIFNLILPISSFLSAAETPSSTKCQEKCTSDYKTCISNTPNNTFECTKNYELCKFHCD